MHITRTRYDLTGRELEVLQLLAEGLTDKDIACRLGITAYAVNKHIGSIMVKMNSRSRTGAAVTAIREHLVFAQAPV